MHVVRQLKKDGYDIRLLKNEDGSYLVEYSNDRFTTKKRREYPDKKSLLEMLIPRFPASEISDID